MEKITLESPVTALNGIGASRAKLFEKLGIYTVSDLLMYFPRGYEDRTRTVPIYEASDGETVCIHATVFSHINERRINSSLSLYSVELADESGSMSATWFNNKYIKRSIIKGESYIFYGKIKRMGARKVIENPIFEKDGSIRRATGKIIPLYPLTANLTQKIIQNAVSDALCAVEQTEEALPLSLRQRYGLADVANAIRSVHFPSSTEECQAARRRLVFEDLLILMLSLAKLKTAKTQLKQTAKINTAYVNEFEAVLPFSFTNAQRRVVKEICADLICETPMNRLVQGDVGSGKTAVAAAAMYAVAKSGYQAALMAPTEVLAAQHYESFTKMMDGRVRICLLTGSVSKREKDKICEQIKNGEFDIIIGTHAIIQENISYKSLALVITDEQHRFGVVHRDAIAKKGKNPHIMVMSATPIPRTLALIIYGDLDISVIDELPPGRKSVLTYSVGENMRKRVYAFIHKHITSGSQAYIVCPLIEESEKSDLKNITEYANKLQKIFPDFKCALMHSRLKNDAKDEIMQRFKNGEIDILISTTVIEVGVDVKNANIMIIENAEHFGLSQLHQLRGRVGRGDKQSYCIMFSHSDSETAQKRMKIMCTSNDGFYISEQDLQLRGPGEFFGTKQHGIPSRHIANLLGNASILHEVQCAKNELCAGQLRMTASEQGALMRKVASLTDKILL